MNVASTIGPYGLVHCSCKQRRWCKDWYGVWGWAETDGVGWLGMGPGDRYCPQCVDFLPATGPEPEPPLPPKRTPKVVVGRQA